ncbi:hypothetical protein O3M35_010221 [Rhynocoris fuscipes]|uniref:Circadian clock-controlled protein n=1 Tax=Rhynocoris fuscipes TaxID=488301 RepID=A0AAW1CYF8_9HEMI
MMYTNLIFTICLGFTINLVESKKLPDYIPTCKRSDPKFDQCVLNAIEVSRPYLIKGIPKIRVPALEPLEIPQLDINRDQPNLKVKALLKNIKINGASAFKVTKLRCDPNALNVEMTIQLPFTTVTCDYDVDGRLLVVPLVGKGVFRGNFTDIVADVKATGEIISSKKGVKYIAIKTVRTKVKVGDQVVRFVNTDNNRNNDLITQTAANFINQNRRQVLEIVLPIAEETADAIVKSMGNNVLRSIPYNELLPQ